MTREQRLESATRFSNQSARLLIVSDIASDVTNYLRSEHIAEKDWVIQTYSSVDKVLADGELTEPDLVVLELSAGSPSGAALFEHAKLVWPRTVFMLFTTRDSLAGSALVEAYGDMATVCTSDIKTLCEGIAEEAFALSFGLLRGLSLPSMLQMMSWDKKSAAILVHTGATWGRLHLRKGELVNAYIHHTGETGETAALDILSWEKVTLFLERSYHNQHQVIKRSLSNLLMEAMRVKDEKEKIDEFDITMLLLDDETDGAGSIDSLKSKKGAQQEMKASASLKDIPVKLDISMDSSSISQLSTESEDNLMENVKTTLDAALEGIDGAMAIALVDYSSGMALGTAGTGIDLEIAAAGNTDVVRAKLRTMESLGIQGSIEDMLITLVTQYHLLFLIPNKTLFLYLVLNKERSNLAMARYKLKALAAELKV